METRIHEALNETYQNYILPFSGSMAKPKQYSERT